MDKNDKTGALCRAVMGITCAATAIVLAVIIVAIYRATHEPQTRCDAVVLTKAGVITAQWNYQQLPMKECKWCRRTVNLNRHHVVPQAANPALRDVKENLIVLCRDCHFVLGHRCNWKQYNPDVFYIAAHFTNCVKSADTRAEVEKPAGGPFTPVPDAPAPDTTGLLPVTNDVPAEQRSALERILKWNPESQSR